MSSFKKDIEKMERFTLVFAAVSASAMFGYILFMFWKF